MLCQQNSTLSRAGFTIQAEAVTCPARWDRSRASGVLAKKSSMAALSAASCSQQGA